MQSTQILDEIREANLTYLMLARDMIRTNKEAALSRLGMSADSADAVAGLSPAQLVKIASGNLLLCRFRASEEMVWELLTRQTVPGRTERTIGDRLHRGASSATDRSIGGEATSQGR